MRQPADHQALVSRIQAAAHPLEPLPTAVSARIAPLPHIRAVLFDVYGTLLISASGDIALARGGQTADTLQEALERAEWPHPPAPYLDPTPALREVIENHHRLRRRTGITFPEVDIRAVWREVLGSLTGLAQKALPDPLIERIAVEYEARVNPVWPMPGLADTLAGLAAHGYVLGIVSNAQFMTPLLFEALLGQRLEALGFDPACCVFSYRLLEAKPSPTLYEEALAGLEREHAILADEVLYVGNDMRNDIWPAAGVGFRTALFAGDARSLRLREGDPDCAGVTPDRVITELRQIPEVLLPARGRPSQAGRRSRSEPGTDPDLGADSD